MNDRDNRRYDMFGRVETFGRKNAVDFAPDSEGGKHFAAMSQIILDVDSAKAGQQPGHATVKAVLLTALRQNLYKIVRTAGAVAQDAPGFAAKFLLPESHKETALVSAADAILAELTKPGVADKFIAHELSADFVQHLAANRQAVVDAQDEMESDDHTGLKNTATINRLMRAGKKEVKYLDAIVRNKYAENPEQLHVWTRASTLERRTRRKKAPSPPTPGTVPATPAASS